MHSRMRADLRATDLRALREYSARRRHARRASERRSAAVSRTATMLARPALSTPVRNRERTPATSAAGHEVDAAEELLGHGLPCAPVLVRAALERGPHGTLAAHDGPLLLVPAQRHLGRVLVHVVARLKRVVRAATHDRRRSARTARGTPCASPHLRSIASWMAVSRFGDQSSWSASSRWKISWKSVSRTRSALVSIEPLTLYETVQSDAKALGVVLPTDR